VARAEGPVPTELNSSTAVAARKRSQPKGGRALFTVGFGALVIGAIAAVVLVPKLSVAPTTKEAEPAPATGEAAADDAEAPGQAAEAPGQAAEAPAKTPRRPLPFTGAPERDVAAGPVGEFMLARFRVLGREASFGKAAA
jgi:hypothetical protein